MEGGAATQRGRGARRWRKCSREQRSRAKAYDGVMLLVKCRAFRPLVGAIKHKKQRRNASISSSKISKENTQRTGARPPKGSGGHGDLMCATCVSSVLAANSYPPKSLFNHKSRSLPVYINDGDRGITQVGLGLKIGSCLLKRVVTRAGRSRHGRL